MPEHDSIDALAADAARIAHPVFRSEQWLYGLDPHATVPSHGRLITAVNECLVTLAEDPEGAAVSTGRFMVQRDGTFNSTVVYLELGWIKNRHLVIP